MSKRTAKSPRRYVSIAAQCLLATLLLLAASSNSKELTRQELAALIMLISNSSQYSEPEPVTPLEFYSQNIAKQVVSGRCVLCHVEGGVAPNGGARIVFTNDSSAGQDEANVEAFRAYLDLVGDDGATVLSKIRGVSHGGGTIFPASTTEYQAVASFLELLSGGSAEVEGTGFFKGVTLASREQTLRRAAIILAGRLPTVAEIDTAKADDNGLRAAVLGLMKGAGFHDFLVRGANDRLHTDGFLNGLFLEAADLNSFAGNHYPIGADKFFLPKPFTQEQEDARWDYFNRFSAGVARAPLELIAYVVENNRPYTEILTANYTMVNPFTSEVYRSNVSFAADEDFRVFKPGLNRGAVLRDDQYEAQFIQESGLKFISHGDFLDYPHSGILNEPAWLNRYPSTETNRNRARARWTYYHFLGFDIESSAPRTTDPEALADTNNPTLLNPACIVCHERMDPVAGAYQNYSNEGLYRTAEGGLDSLPDTYKYPEWFEENYEPSPYQEGDTWYRTMRNPGFESQLVPANRTDDALAWLGQTITSDPRFATATVAFWWPALMGAEVRTPPEVPSDPNYDQLVRGFDAQQGTIQEIAQKFSNNGFKLKAMLADLVLSPWFRAKAATATAASTRRVELASLGIDRLLTPEELERKTRAILGYAWSESPADWTMDGVFSALDDRFRIYYGGIDSVGIKDRSTAMTALMANVAERQALELACGAVSLEFMTANPANRRLFTGVDATTTPTSDASQDYNVTIGSYSSRTKYDLEAAVSGGKRKIRIFFNNDGYNQDTNQDRNLYIDSIQILRDGQVLQTQQAEQIESAPGFAQTTYDDGNVMGGVEYADVNGQWQAVGWNLWGEGFVAFEANLPGNGVYTFRVRAWGSGSGDGVKPHMTIAVDSTDTTVATRGSKSIKAQIRGLYKQLLGDDLPESDPEIAAVYELLVETWADRRAQSNNAHAWTWPQEDCIFPRELTNAEWEVAGSDPQQMLYSWTSVLHYFLTHFDYLHE